MRTYAALLGALILGATALLGAPAQAQQQMGTIKVIAPTEGATVSSPVTLRVDIQGVTVKPAAEGDPNAFHYHALVDVDPATVIQAGQPIPPGQENIIHTHEPTLTLNLEPGQHTVTVILTRTDHVPLVPNVQDRVTFTVAAPGQPPAAQTAPAAMQPATTAAQPPTAPAAAGQRPGAVGAPRAGSGGAMLADNHTSTMMVALLAAALALGVGGSLAYARRRTHGEGKR